MIINGWTDENSILALRAAQKAIKDKAAPGALMYIEFENGAAFSVKRNKASISVWPTKEPGQ